MISSQRRLLARLSPLASRLPNGCSGSRPCSSAADDKLILRNDFIGIKRTPNFQAQKSPEIALSRIRGYLSQNQRITAQLLFTNIIEPLENNDETLQSVLLNSGDRWLPMLIRSTGLSMSNVSKSTRCVLFDRFWRQIIDKNITVTVDMFNARLQVYLENEHEFVPAEELNYLQELNIQPNQETFQHVLEQFARKGDVESFRHMIYQMAMDGCVVDAKCNSSLVLCHAVRGKHAKADSLVEQTREKYSDEAWSEAQGACARAAAIRGDTDRLRHILRYSVDKDLKLLIPLNDILETIWLLTNSSSQMANSLELERLIKQIFERIKRTAGFFHLLVREIDRYISHQHYQIAIHLLDDSKRIEDCLRNQQKYTFVYEIISRMARSLIRNGIPVNQLHNVANRVSSLFKNADPRIYDDLLYASLTFKDLSIDDRISYLKEFCETVDPDRSRQHLMLPLISRADTTENRLKTIFRCSHIGYGKISELDIRTFSKLVLQPLYDEHRSFSRTQHGSRLNKIGKVLTSFGVDEKEIWNTFHAWMKLKSTDEAKISNSDDHVKPLSTDLKGWLRFHYEKYFFDELPTVPKVKPTYDRLKTIVESGDSTALSSFINSYGWPEETQFEEILPGIFTLYLEHEEWHNVKKMLLSLSRVSSLWFREGDPFYSPVRNCDLLDVLKRMSKEGDSVVLSDLINYCYELKRLFPFSNSSYGNFQDTLISYRQLFASCIYRLDQPTVTHIDQCIELLHTLIKLDIVHLHATENLTNVFVKHVLEHIGWDDAVSTWLKFQTSLSCSNGIVALLQGCIYKNPNKPVDMKQYVLHKAQNFMSPSRVHAIHAGVLISAFRLAEAETILSNEEILSSDLLFTFKLLRDNGIKNIDKKQVFMHNFLEKTLQHTSLAKDTTEVKEMWSAFMRICEVRALAPAALKLYELFKTHNIVLEDSEKLRISKLAERHSELVQKWITGPEGLLNITEDDPLAKANPLHKMQEQLKADIEEIKQKRESSV